MPTNSVKPDHLSPPNLLRCFNDIIHVKWHWTIYVKRQWTIYPHDLMLQKVCSIGYFIQPELVVGLGCHNSVFTKP